MAFPRAILTSLLFSAVATACSQENDFSAPALLSKEPACLCGPTQARNMGKLLLQSNPLIEIDEARWNNFVNSIDSHAHLFTEDGPTLTCARKLGSAMVYTGLSSFSRADYDSSYGRVLEMGGTIEQAQDVASSMQSGALDAYMTGKELLWLAEVIPSAARGDWQAFRSTGTESRRQFREVIPILQMSGLGADLGALAPYVAQFEPLVEEQMVMAACLFRQ